MNKRYLREKSILYLFKIAITLLITGSMFLVWFFYYNPKIVIGLVFFLNKEGDDRYDQESNGNRYWYQHQNKYLYK